MFPWATTCWPCLAASNVSAGRLPPSEPIAVTDRMRVSPPVTSPPTSSAEYSPVLAAIPAATPRRKDTGVDSGAESASSAAMGRAPIASMSAKFAVMAFAPTSSAVDQVVEKWRPSMSMSVATTAREFGAALSSTAASSPLRVLGAAATIASMTPRSPTSPTVGSVSGGGFTLTGPFDRLTRHEF